MRHQRVLNRRVNGFVKRIQRGTITINSGSASSTATIAAVDTANVILNFLGYTSNTPGADPGSPTYVVLTNATTVTALRDSSIDTTPAIVVSYEVIEFWPGVLRSAQAFSVTLGVSASGTATLTTPVDTNRAMVFMLGNTCNNYDEQRMRMRWSLTDGTTVTVTSDPGAAASARVAQGIVAEFN